MTLIITTVADGVHFVEGPASNWIVLGDGDGVTLIDSGYPGDYSSVLSSLAELGFRPEQINAVLVTHAHVDHIGSLARLSADYGTRILLSEQEVHHARREYLAQASPADVFKRAWRPRVLKLAVHVMKTGGTTDVRLDDPQPFDAATLDVPGRPVPLLTPGHTSGHACFHLPDVGIVVTGDALVTGHHLSAITGPQMLPTFFHHDIDESITSLSILDGLPAETILPGHGAVWQGPLSTAIIQARERYASKARWTL